MELKAIIGNNLKAIRKQRSLNQAEVAKMLKLSQPAIAKFEKGQASPSIDNLYAYSMIFDVSMDFIFGITKNKKGGIIKPEIFQGMSSYYASMFTEPKENTLQLQEDIKQALDEYESKTKEK